MLLRQPETETGDLGLFGTVHGFVDKTWQHITYCNEKRIQLGFGGRSPKEYWKHMIHHGVA